MNKSSNKPGISQEKVKKNIDALGKNSDAFVTTLAMTLKGKINKLHAQRMHNA